MKLAIRGHSTRGSEVIALLEMLGGNNIHNLSGDGQYSYYTINESKIKIYTIIDPILNDKDWYFFTIEELLEKYPYKVGNIARLSRSNIAVIIKAMKWENNEIVYKLSCDDGWWSIDNLKPYKEETMEERKYSELRMPLDDDDKLATEVTIGGNKMLPPNGYLIGKITQVDNGMLIEYVKKQPQYPKTYKDCCDILGFKNRNKTEQQFLNSCDLYDAGLMTKLSMLKVCRDAYWKIAGEEMGLGKPWEPDWKEDSDKYFICYLKNELWMSNVRDCNRF